MKILISIFLVLFVAELLAQDSKEKNVGEIQDVEIVVEKEKEILLPQAIRFYTPSDLKITNTKLEPVIFKIVDPDVVIPEYTPLLNAKSIDKEKLTTYKNHYLKAALGTYYSPFLNYRYQNFNNEDNVFGIGVLHESFKNGPIQDELSGENENEIQLYHNLKNEKLNLTSKFEYNFQGYYNYGLLDTITSKEALDTIKRQKLSVLRGGFELVTQSANKKLSFNVSPKWQYTSQAVLNADRYNSENNFNTGLDFDWRIDNTKSFSMGINLDYAKYTSSDNLSRSWYYTNPSFIFQINTTSVKIGLTTGIYSDIKKAQNYFIYPDIIISNQLTSKYSIYGVLTGNIYKNKLGDLTLENRHLTSNLNLETAITFLDFSIGSRGLLIDRLAYNSNLGVKRIKNQAFYINDSIDLAQFNLIYENGDMTQYYGFLEFDYRINHLFHIETSFNAYRYRTPTIDEAWHLPTFKLKFQPQFEINKFTLKSNFIMMSGLKAYDYKDGKTSHLNNIYEFGIDAKYFIKESFAIIIKARNLFGSENQRYYYYLTRSYDIKAGIACQF